MHTKCTLNIQRPGSTVSHKLAMLKSAVKRRKTTDVPVVCDTDRHSLLYVMKGYQNA